MNMNHDQLRDLTEAYVLDALPRDQRDAYDAHLVTCGGCSRDVRELMRVTQALGEIVDQREPPARLRERVLASVGRAAAPAPVAVDVRPGRSLPAWMAAAAAVIALATGLYAASLRSNMARLGSELERALSRVASAEQEIVQLRAVSGAAERARMVLVAADVSQVQLRGQQGAPDAHGRALWSGSAGLLFTAVELPALPAGRTYQLWVIAKSKPMSVGLVTPDARGRASFAADLPVGTQPEQVALTIEPAGGVPSPTGPIVLAGTI